MSTKLVHVLLVEDDAGDVELIREGLREAKISLDLADVGDGAEALRYLRKEGRHAGAPLPDIILLDLNMPRMDGREFLEKMKGDKELRHIPVVVLTTSDAEEDILKSYDLGANCFIRKPVGLEEFMKVVHGIESFWLTLVKLPAK